jgi:hypothetical protein
MLHNTQLRTPSGACHTGSSPTQVLTAAQNFVTNKSVFAIIDGIAGLSLTMARGLGSLGIRVNAIAPSLFVSGLTAGISDDGEARLTKDAAFPKPTGRPDEYARLALALIENPMPGSSFCRNGLPTRAVRAPRTGSTGQALRGRGHRQVR